jgi:hypothetical protein
VNNGRDGTSLLSGCRRAGRCEIPPDLVAHEAWRALLDTVVWLAVVGPARGGWRACGAPRARVSLAAITASGPARSLV